MPPELSVSEADGGPGSGAAVDPHVFLAGRPPIAEFMGFMRRAAAGDGRPAPPDAELTGDWRSANDHLRDLEEKESGWADDPPIRPLPPELRPLADRLRADRAFQRCYSFLPCEIALVELDRLVVYQKFVNLARVELIRRSLGPAPGLEAVARLAFGLDRPPPPVRRSQGRDVFTFVCDSGDFRIMEPVLLSPAQLPDLACRGVPAQAVVCAVGFSPNCVSALRAEGRLILSNGSHRAYALRELGVSHVPCVLQTVSRPEEFELIGDREVSQRDELYLKNPRPPLLKDYFDPRLRRIVPVVRSRRLIRVQLRVDQSEIPGP
jgi:hypothetical protein